MINEAVEEFNFFRIYLKSVIDRNFKDDNLEVVKVLEYKVDKIMIGYEEQGSLDFLCKVRVWNKEKMDMENKRMIATVPSSYKAKYCAITVGVISDMEEGSHLD